MFRTLSHLPSGLAFEKAQRCVSAGAMHAIRAGRGLLRGLSWRARCSSIALAALGGLGLASLGAAPARSPDPGWHLFAQIAAEGTARFVSVEEGLRRSAWTVSCRVPLRGCVARGPGIVLRLDGSQAPWLLGPITPGARISLDDGRRREALDGLFARPVPEALVARLSNRQVRLIIEEPGYRDRELTLAGLADVIDYLAWIETHEARTGRDARRWPGLADLVQAGLTEGETGPGAQAISLRATEL
ncbi:hypothetical protein RM543_10795 [Roseicyclus sp. F158]|uniref:Uncharacterized protein n=1 Tax=Tropicimonas omnivorans TaxID=3075590 RepID=A0ABU3DHK3_9RHOB|nr:hypothetical protein [Roseicyclus sp. F158]MDT0683175.1 hypothetical protein [Roseicyclus sp. F158]